jgi:DNA-binding MarR family transcriptional regulator
LTGYVKECVVTDSNTLEQARYIFSVGKMIRRHVFTSLTQLQGCGRETGCAELSMAQMNLLMAVRGADELTLKELADMLRVSPPSVSVMVDRLVERDLLLRERSTRDRRKVVITLSPTADSLLTRVEKKMLTAFVGLVKEVGPETARKWGEVLQRVEQVLQQQNIQE